MARKFVNMLTAETIRAALDNELGYSKYDYKNKPTVESILQTEGLYQYTNSFSLRRVFP